MATRKPPPRGGAKESAGKRQSRAPVKARESSARLRRPTASSTPVPTSPGHGSSYPLIDPKAAAAAAAPDALEVRIASRAGPIPTRIRTYSASNLDPTRIDSILRNADLGIGIYQYADLTKHMRERDSHLMGIDRQRRQGVANKPFLIWPTSDIDPLAVALSHLMRAAADGIDGLPSSVYSALSKNCDGWSMSELIWHPGKIRFQIPDGNGGGPLVTVNGLWPRSIDWVHAKHTEFDQETDDPRINLGGSSVIPLPRHKFLYSLGSGEGIASARGYSRAVVWMHFFKHASIRDWNVFLHLYGIPFLQGKLDRALWKDANMKAILEQALEAYGSGEGAPILPDGMTIEVKDPVSMSGAGEAHKSLAGFCNAEQSKAVLGATLTAEPGQNGAYNLGFIHQDSAHEVIVGDALSTADDLRSDLFLSVLELNAGAIATALNEHGISCRPEDLPLANPLCGFRTDREWTPETRIRIFQASADLGVPPSKSQVRRELQIDKPNSKDDEAKGRPVIVPDGAKTAGSTDASKGVDNPKQEPVATGDDEDKEE